jgi:thiol-disulfide isomerase/thioredoxin
MKQNLPRLLALIVSLACTLATHAATVTIGHPAPALTFTNLLQAPAGSKVDWPSLRGKVVVLEFWATWCGGCIEEIPHLNSMIQSLSANNIQFIAVDDEDPAIVQKFLRKTPINGWLGFDTSARIIDEYDAKVRPRTVVIDTKGRVAGILDPHQLASDQLVALAAGKPVVFPVDQMIEIRQQAFKQAKAADTASAGTTGPKPIFDISVLPGDPGARMAIAHRPGKDGNSDSYDYLNAPLPVLFILAAGFQSTRLVVHSTSLANYSLHVSTPGDIKQLAPALELALLAATGSQLSHVSAEEDAWVLQATPKAASLLSPASSDEQSMCFYNPKAEKLVMMQATLDSLAQQLEITLGKPVVNESGLQGAYDANFGFPKGDVEATRAALESNLGLTLVKAHRTIERTVIDPLPAMPKPADQAAQPGKPAAAPGQMVQSIAVPRQ